MIKKKLAEFLTNKWFGIQLSKLFANEIPDLRWKGFRYDVTPLLANPKLIASVFWGFYESAEKRMIEKYYKGEIDTIELGSSIGVISSHIAKKIHEKKKLICIEANPALLETLANNVDRHRQKNSQFLIDQCVVSPENELVDFYVSDNTTSSNASFVHHGKTISVKGKPLSIILDEQNISEFFLVSDIEGAEAQLFWEEAQSLDHCTGMIIELHDTTHRGTHISIDDMRMQLTQKLAFQEIDRDGNVFYFSRKKNEF